MCPGHQRLDDTGLRGRHYDAWHRSVTLDTNDDRGAHLLPPRPVSGAQGAAVSDGS